MFKLSNNSKKHRKGIDPRLIEISDLAITLTPIDFGHDRYAGKRTPLVQNKLFKQNKSNCDGYKKLSNHQFGKALDFYAYIHGRLSYEPQHLAMVAAAFFQAACTLGYSIKWGGLWKSRKGAGFYGWDMPHIELIED